MKPAPPVTRARMSRTPAWAWFAGLRETGRAREPVSRAGSGAPRGRRARRRSPRPRVPTALATWWPARPERALLGGHDRRRRLAAELDRGGARLGLDRAQPRLPARVEAGELPRRRASPRAGRGSRAASSGAGRRAPRRASPGCARAAGRPRCCARRPGAPPTPCAAGKPCSPCSSVRPASSSSSSSQTRGAAAQRPSPAGRRSARRAAPSGRRAGAPRRRARAARGARRGRGRVR